MVDAAGVKVSGDAGMKLEAKLAAAGGATTNVALTWDLPKARFFGKADQPGLMKSNLGMYRIQLAGNQYQLNRQIGLHYQLHRGIGVHQQAAMRKGEPFRVNIFVGGTPAMTVAAVMPLPEV